MNDLSHEPRGAARRAANVSLDVELVREAKALGVDISRACERGLLAEVRAERSRRWADENRAAIESSNDYVLKHGLPLARYRMF